VALHPQVALGTVAVNSVQRKVSANCISLDANESTSQECLKLQLTLASGNLVDR